MRDKGESGWLSAIYHVIHEGLLISQAALRQRLVSRRYPLPETGNPFVMKCDWCLDLWAKRWTPAG